MNNPILITGCARSGTSLIAGIINICGAFGGDMTRETPYNQKGQFENTKIRNTLIKPYLKALGVDPMGQWPLPVAESVPPVIGWHEFVEDVLTSEGYTGGPWFFKGAKMCLMWPVWHTAYPKAHWIIVRRPRDAIIKSCLRTPFMRAFKDHVGWSKWVEHHENCFSNMKLWGLRVTEIWSNDVVAGNVEPVKAFVEDVGLTWDEKRVNSFIDPRLMHNELVDVIS